MTASRSIQASSGSTGLPWLAAREQQLEAQLAQGLTPHALLLHGPEGLGRRELAAWLVRRLLPDALTVAPEADCSEDPLRLLAHPDLYLVSPEQGSRGIAVDQVRELIARLQLTSHRQGRKLAVIEPAEAMNHAACNSLLKTLEEPPGNATLLLIGRAAARLPATIVSRCQRIRLAAPPAVEALGWLRRREPRDDWAQLLEWAGGAPLLAARLASAGHAEGATGLQDDLRRLSRGEVTPVAVARRWAGQEPGDCLGWLYWQVAVRIRERQLAMEQGENAELSLLTAGQNVKDLHRLLDRVAGLKRLLERSVNVELQLADLLANGFSLPVRKG
jgi:DNA polymerase-3 subunit delta'